MASNLFFSDHVVASPSKWYVVSTTPRHEKRVSRHFQARHIEHYLPLYRLRHRWNDGSKVVVDLPLFPGYVFVQLNKSDHVRALQVPGVLRFVVGTQGEAASLEDTEIRSLQSGLDPHKTEPWPHPATGQRVRIRSGALGGIEGVVVRWKNRFRVILTLTLISQNVAVEIDAEDLEPLRR